MRARVSARASERRVRRVCVTARKQQLQLELFTRAVELEGLVVTGTAIAAQRRELGNSVTLITSEQISKVGAVNFEDILRGRALGVSVTGTSGTAGAGSNLLLRGVNSVNGRNQPLIYIDGVRMPTDNPEDSNTAPAMIGRVPAAALPARSSGGSAPGPGTADDAIRRDQYGPIRSRRVEPAVSGSSG